MPSLIKTVSPIEAARMAREIRRLVCSGPWFDACWTEIQRGKIKARQRLDVALDAARLYPPGGIPKPSRPHPTQMRQCSSCGATWYPPQYVRTCSGRCEDCIAGRAAPWSDERTHLSSTSSPSAAAIRELQFRRQRLVELPLAADDERSLRREIAKHQRKTKASKRSSTSP